MDYPLTSLLTYYGNPFWYEVGHFFPALWVNYSPALTKGELIAEHARNYGQNQQILKLAHYLPLLEYKPRSILEAKPVRQNLSAALLQFLETNAFSSEQLVEILRLCAADGENAFWEHKEQFMVSDRKAHILTDPVKVQQTDLSMYDQLLQEGGTMCRTQV